MSEGESRAIRWRARRCFCNGVWGFLRRYQDALDYIDNLGLLPTSGSETGDTISSRVHRFHQLEAPVRRVMDDVMLLSMECFQHLYAEVISHAAHVLARQSYALAML